jgi:hypothetical protein
MVKLTNFKRYGTIFTNRKKAEDYRKHWNLQAKKQEVNLRYKIFKRGKKYIVTQESKRKLI